MATDAEDTSLRTRWMIRVGLDLTCIVMIAIPVLLIDRLAVPFHRGFFCDDQSLMHPYKADTVPLWLLIIVAIGLPLITILLVEFLPRRKRSWCVVVPFDATPTNNSNKEACYRILAVFFFGLAITQLLTEIGKYSVGRLRPHFLSVCSPQNLPLNCSNIFIVQDVCTGDSPDKIKEARLSFPSGHASMAMFAAAFLMMYLQARLVCSYVKLLKTVMQVAVFCLALLTCLSRISDFKHHWSDVLGGSLLGLIVCYLLVTSLKDYHHPFFYKRPIYTSLVRKHQATYTANGNSSSDNTADVHCSVQMPGDSCPF
ncbi:hypothetical protein C0Q70_16969 [Pomacea canaliculata]|uniref:Phosphatidic acid phosphatase type 2/haloperoxidase domain-containing protein n=1 Tax=Pomacea canaliculata TaxID=400727 RepID=A0A2T7NRB0_POMCA|nr:phospholipid phosphatase 1-like [Pomacea canaliculata]PVD23696.1 hypothetical protein C0Q70_16969 [Pomacea canaliculata]